ncbi:MAG: hypothetical protein ACRD1J_12025 [Terriglobia bacterium]
MDLPAIPGPDETIADLSGLHPEIHRAFEHGVFKAKNHFEVEALDYDPSAFSTLVRLHAKEYFKRKGLDAVEIEDVNLCGLSLRLPKYVIKMWKSDNSELPVPGRSEPKQEFYQQPILFPDEESNPLPLLHLAVLWNLNGSRNLTALWLVCPKSGHERSAESYWCSRIPDPASSIHVEVSQVSPSDLQMELKADPATKTKTG